MIGQILLQLILIALNAIFACAEIAVISSNETRIDKLAEQGSKPAKRLQALQNRPAQFLATIQVLRSTGTAIGELGRCHSAGNLANHFRCLDYHFAFLPDACFRRTCPETNCHAKGRIHCVGYLRHDSGTGKTLLAAGLAADSCHQWRIAAVPH